MKSLIYLSLFLAIAVQASANRIAESQQRYVEVYAQQKQKVAPEDALINTDPEPDLSHGFVDLFNGKNLDGWTSIGGHCQVEVIDGAIVGTVVPGSPSTYISTVRDDFTDFIFTAEVKWQVNSNSGIMFRAKRVPSSQGETVAGPQAEMEPPGQRNWSGGIYGQGAGGWRYPLWLEAHEAARAAIKGDDWNRITILGQGTTVKTWLNGIPAAHWTNDRYLKGFFSLQVHQGKQGEVHFRNIKVKELKPATGPTCCN